MPDAGVVGVAVFACGEANGSGDETRDLIVPDAAEQYVPLDVFGEVCKTDVRVLGMLV